MSSILRALVGAATVLAVSHAAPLAAQSSAPQRFAYVDTKIILDAAPGRAEAEAALQKEAVAWDAEVKKMQDANIALVTEFQKNSATMTATDKALDRAGQFARYIGDGAAPSDEPLPEEPMADGPASGGAGDAPPPAARPPETDSS